MVTHLQSNILRVQEVTSGRESGNSFGFKM